MSRLYVGCRVRILLSIGWPELAGQEGRIVCRAADSAWANPVPKDWVVRPDSWGSARAFCKQKGRMMEFAPSADQLEPIIPEGHQVISWEEMAGLWTPEKVGV